jgi:hypothetical protein
MDAESTVLGSPSDMPPLLVLPRRYIRQQFSPDPSENMKTAADELYGVFCNQTGSRSGHPVSQVASAMSASQLPTQPPQPLQC